MYLTSSSISIKDIFVGLTPYIRNSRNVMSKYQRTVLLTFICPFTLCSRMTSNTCFIHIVFEQRRCSYAGRVMNKKCKLCFRIFLSKTTLSIDKLDQNLGNKIQKEKYRDKNPNYRYDTQDCAKVFGHHKICWFISAIMIIFPWSICWHLICHLTCGIWFPLVIWFTPPATCFDLFYQFSCI